MKRRRLLPAPGFSLIEVSAAVAIVSIALISLMGLIPMGLANARATRNETRAAALVTTIASTLGAETFVRAMCFGTNGTSPLDLSLLDNRSDENDPPIILFASYDARRDFASIIRSDSLPSEMQGDLETLRIEMRNVPLVVTPDDGAIGGSTVHLRIFPTTAPEWKSNLNEDIKRLRASQVILVASTYIADYTKAGVLTRTAP